jgi:hypothetical protein
MASPFMGSIDGTCTMIRQQQISFVARIWLERKKNGDTVWRGHVRHVQGEREAEFQDFDELGDFMEKVARIPASDISNRSTPGGAVEPTKPKNWAGNDDRTHTH